MIILFSFKFIFENFKNPVFRFEGSTYRQPFQLFSMQLIIIFISFQINEISKSRKRQLLVVCFQYTIRRKVFLLCWWSEGSDRPGHLAAACHIKIQLRTLHKLIHLTSSWDNSYFNKLEEPLVANRLALLIPLSSLDFCSKSLRFFFQMHINLKEFLILGCINLFNKITELSDKLGDFLELRFAAEECCLHLEFIFLSNKGLFVVWNKLQAIFSASYCIIFPDYLN